MIKRYTSVDSCKHVGSWQITWPCANSTASAVYTVLDQFTKKVITVAGNNVPHTIGWKPCSTVLIFLKGQHVWWSVTLETRAFLYKIWIMNRPDCCLEELPSLQVTLKNIKNSAIAADCQVYQWKVEQRRLLICEPSIMTTNVTILADKAESLSLCEVLITATG